MTFYVILDYILEDKLMKNRVKFTIVFSFLFILSLCLVFTGCAYNQEKANIPNDIVYNENKEDQMFNLNIIRNGEGGSFSGQGKYKAGEHVIISAVGDTENYFDKWIIEDNDIIESTFTLVMPEKDINIIAKFSPYIKYSIYLSATIGGSVNGCFNNEVYNIAVYENDFLYIPSFLTKDDTYILKASPKESYIFDGWYNNDELYSKESELTLSEITENINLQARFVKKTYLVTIETNTSLSWIGGSLSISGSQIRTSKRFEIGEELYFYTGWNNGCRFIGWYVNGVKYNTNTNTLTIKVENENLYIEARYIAE